jgi:hypothetical protein
MTNLQLPRRQCEWILDHPRLVLGLVAVVTLVCAGKLATSSLTADPFHAFVDDDATLARHYEQTRRFGDDGSRIIVVASREGRRLFEPETLDALRRAVALIGELPEVQSVASLADAHRSAPATVQSTRSVVRRTIARRRLLSGRSPGESESPELYWPPSPALQQGIQLDALRDDMLADPAVGGALLSRDGRCQAMLITLQPTPTIEVAQQRQTVRQIEVILLQEGLGREGVYRAGFPVNNLAMVDAMGGSFAVLLPLGGLLLGGLLLVFFRRISVALLALALGGVAVVWGLGATAFVFGELTILVAGAPLVVLAVSTTDFIHLTSAYQQELRRGAAQREAIVTVYHKVGGACLLTSLTTLVGFGSLLIVEGPTVRHFGFASAVGAASALLLVLFVAPLVLANMAPLPAARGEDAQRKSGIVARVLDRCHAIGARRPRTVLSLAALACLPALAALSQRKVEADLPERFSHDHPVRQGLRLMEEQFSGSSTFDIYLTAPAHRLLDGAPIARLAAWEREVRSWDAVRDVRSVNSVFRTVDSAVGYQTDNGLPPSQAAAEASIAWARQIQPAVIGALVPADGQGLRIQVAVRGAGFREIADLADRAVRLGQELMPGVQVEAGGVYPLVGRAIGRIVDSQVQGLAFCVISIGVIMSLGLWSLRVGLLSQIPNVIPVVLMMGLIAVTRRHIDSDMLALPMIALGLAVDDTIHFLHRFRDERASGAEVPAAIEETYRSTGRAIIISTIVLGGGLLPLALSPVLSLSMLGTYLVAGLAGALAADLLCLPALLQLRWIRFGEVKRSQGSSDTPKNDPVVTQGRSDPGSSPCPKPR